MKFAPILVPIAGAFVLAASACTGGEETELTKVFTAPPWTGDESLKYDLVLRDDEIYGQCTIETKLNAEDGHTRLNRLCGDGNNRDDGTVVVEAGTLKPLSSSRTVVHPEDDDRWSYTTVYEPPVVKFTADTNGKVNQTERELAEADETSPNPGYYDDESLLWLVRGIDLRDGYEGSYQNVNASTGRVFTVTLSVDGQEKVNVAAGEFTAWKVRIKTSSVTNFVWVETGPQHRVIKARFEGLEDVTYELTGE